MISERGTGRLLKKFTKHPYIGQPPLGRKAIEKRILNNVNKGREYRGKAIETTYYLTVLPSPEKV